MTEVHLSSFNTGNFNKGAGFIKNKLFGILSTHYLYVLPGILLWE